MIKQLLLVSLLILGCAPENTQNTAQVYLLTDGSSIDFASPEKLVIINYGRFGVHPVGAKCPN